MSKVLLLHGAWHNGKCWYKVSKILEAEGYEVEILTLPGNGEKDSKDVSYSDYVDYVKDVVSRQNGKVTVLGHSSAGHVLQSALPAVTDKLEKVVLNNAWLLPDGKSQFDFVPDDIKEGMRQGAKATGTGAIPIDPGFVRGLLATEADEETFSELMELLVEQPLIIMEEPVASKDFFEMDVPMVMLYNTKDKSVAPGAFLQMFQALGDKPVVEVECDHEGLFTAPEVYTEGLIKALKL